VTPYRGVKARGIEEGGKESDKSDRAERSSKLDLAELENEG
jgi:hypothetical protein